MPLRGDLKALGGFLKKLQKLPDASREIAVALGPVVGSLVEESFQSQASPNGGSWPATKSGAPAFGGSEGMGYVLSRLVGKLSIRTTVLYPLHFHQDGTHRIGRKRGRKIASKITSAYIGNVLKSLGMKGSAPKKRKGESDEAFAERVAKFQAVKQTRSDAKAGAKRRAAEAVEEARTAGGWHDPPRPMIPDEGDPIPVRWEMPIREAASDVMARFGATEK